MNHNNTIITMPKSLLLVLVMLLINCIIIIFLLFSLVWFSIYVVGKANTLGFGWAMLILLTYNLVFIGILMLERYFVFRKSMVDSVIFIVVVEILCTGIALFFLHNQILALFLTYLLPITILNTLIKPRNHMIGVYVVQTLLFFGTVFTLSLIQS